MILPQIHRVIQDTSRPLQLTIEHNPQSPDDLLRSNRPQDISCPDSCALNNLTSTHKLPSLEEEPSPGEDTTQGDEPIRMRLSPTQHQGTLGMRSRHIMYAPTAALLWFTVPVCLSF